LNKTIKQLDNQKDASIFTPPRRSSNPLKDCNQSKNIEKQGFFSFFSKLIFGYKFGAKPCEDFKQSIEDIIENDEDEAHIEEKTMLKNVLNFSDKKVEDIMIPRMEVNYISAELSLDELKAKIAERAKTRMPVCENNNLDNITGFIHIKDFVRLLVKKENSIEDFEIKKLTRNILFVPPSMPVISLLLKMKADRVHMAAVVDEYGGTSGIITMNDLIEEIFGEIEDEHEEETPEYIKKISDKIFEIDARLEITEFERRFKINLPQEDKEDIETLGGFVCKLANRLPVVGEIIKFKNIEFKIQDGNLKKIKKLLLKK